VLLERPPQAWWALTALLVLTALVGQTVAPALLDWQPQRLWTEPWRWWTPVAVHYSALHLVANLVGAACLAWLAWSARIDVAMALAWALAWPLTHLGLALRPELLHYGGLSGVLHAGVAVIGLHLLRHRPPWGGALLIGLGLKVMLEQPGGPVAQRFDGLDIAVAPWSHLSGAVAGVLCAALALVLKRRPAK
jgi:rhomboid family GlyGly-CTERM serine protease